MEVTILKSKIHRAVVTQAELDYIGSITIDRYLMEEAGIIEYEQVHIADINNGSRFVTYAIAGEERSGIICLNGAGARLVTPGDKIIIMSYCQIDREEAQKHKPTVVFVDDTNKVCSVNSPAKDMQAQSLVYEASVNC